MIRTRRTRRTRRTGPTGHRSEAGFTLIELLVALTLLGLISVVLFGGLRFGTRAWEAGNVRADQLAQVQAVQAMLRRRIAQALPPGPLPPISDAADAADERGTFAGESSGMHFLAVVPSRASVGGIYAIDIAVIEDSAEGAQAVRLEFTWRLYRADDEAEPGDTPEAGLGGRRVLIEGLASAGFRYFGASAPGEAADWHDLWDSEDGLPGLIAIEAEFPEGDGRAWPVLQVAPKLGGSMPASGRVIPRILGESE